MNRAPSCPFCSHVLLRHVRSGSVYWLCRRCREEIIFPPKLLEADRYPKVLEPDRQPEWQQSPLPRELASSDYTIPTVEVHSPLTVAHALAYGHRLH
ncbi:hypothetical protein ACN4EK_22460 [Pantanalinema rosaneae CENA516]|uniref:hypothetical protein n=1 Tax=Pantanalinema rosaneae TaxID=1620701 RepID=UPI003D6E744E